MHSHYRKTKPFSVFPMNWDSHGLATFFTHCISCAHSQAMCGCRETVGSGGGRSTERQYCKDGRDNTTILGESTWPAILNCHGIHGENWAVCTLKCPYLNWFSWPLFKELILGVPEVKETWMHFWYEFAGKAFYSRTRFHWFCAF